MARTFSGTGQFLSLASGLSLAANDPVWLSAWFYLNSSANQVVFSLGRSGGNNNRRYVDVNGSNWRVVAVNGSGTSTTAGSTAVSTGQWTHVLAEWGSGSSRGVTVNGGTTQTDATSNSLGTAPDQTRIGAHHTATASTASGILNGRVAYVAVFSGAPAAQDYIDLSGSGVEANALHPSLTTSAANLIAYWDLDGTASPEPDGVGSNDMVLTGSPTQSTSPSIQLTGGGGPAIILPQGWWV